jgi:hypothetical protein
MPAVTIEERNANRRQSGRGGERHYVIKGATDEPTARAALLGGGAGAPPSSISNGTGKTLLLSGDESWVEDVTGTTWFGVAVYVPFSYDYTPPGSFSISFDISAQTQRIMQSRQTRGTYVKPGFVAQDFKGAIGVQHDKSIEGCDIQIPATVLTINQTVAAADVDQAYIVRLTRAVGTMSKTDWKGYFAGELLFVRASGQQRLDGNWDLAFGFAFNPNEIVTIDDIGTGGGGAGVNKRGWDYLWCYYEPVNDDINHVTPPRPTAAYVERVYNETDFATLGIG